MVAKERVSIAQEKEQQVMLLLPLFLDAPPVRQGTGAGLCVYASTQDWFEEWCALFAALDSSVG